MILYEPTCGNRKVRKLPKHIESPDPSIYRSLNYVVLDFETTNKDKGDPLRGDNQVVCSAWLSAESVQGRRKYRIRTKFGGEFQQDELVKSVERADFIVAHNSKFELQWLRRCGVDIGNLVVFDTQIGEYVLNGNRKVPLGLDSVARRRGIGGKTNVVSTLMDGGVCPSEMPKEWLSTYVRNDVRITHKLFLQQLEELERLDLIPVLFTRCLLTPVLAEVEHNGMVLDKERVYDEYRKTEHLLAECEHELQKLAPGVNFNSPKQVGELIYDKLGFNEPRTRSGQPLRTPAGGRKADSGTISKLVARTQRQRDFKRLYIQQTKLSARITKNLEFFKAVCERYDGKFYGRFNQTVTQTHRLSSSGRHVDVGKGKSRGVQFQNFPREYKSLFKARHEGWEMGEGDGAQLEFRVGTFLGQDPQGYEDIVNGADIHQFTASILECSRQDAKTHTFKPLYGGQSGTKKQIAYYDAFRNKYNKIYETQRGWTYEVLKTKQLITPWGLRYYWPDTRMTASGFITNTPSIFNYPVQALATAEIIPIAVVYFWHRLRAAGARSFVVNTIHDSIISEIHPEERELFKELVVQALTNDVYFYLDKVYGLKFNVPLGAGIKIAKHWGEGEETKVTVKPPFKFGER